MKKETQKLLGLPSYVVTFEGMEWNAIEYSEYIQQKGFNPHGLGYVQAQGYPTFDILTDTENSNLEGDGFELIEATPNIKALSKEDDKDTWELISNQVHIQISWFTA
ncbi:hypothetical protein BT96DRAFT_999085 [Gymnopus androsaceus JB14]|uniref:Uncharacterized protein n=1 Tax=Gymnopus androsaceus JB14 TaxID=1447944 RepID=A0A6A4H8Z8_9AGAR|nr:hypothetical protein BT96DRAFT_999085 [Gymnopus androsaceus JB14]